MPKKWALARSCSVGRCPVTVDAVVIRTSRFCKHARARIRMSLGWKGRRLLNSRFISHAETFSTPFRPAPLAISFSFSSFPAMFRERGLPRNTFWGGLVPPLLPVVVSSRRGGGSYLLGGGDLSLLGGVCRCRGDRLLSLALPLFLYS